MRQPPSIDAWGGGGFRVAGVWRPGSLLIVDDQPRDWAVTALADLTPASFAEVFAAQGTVEFVLLGVGLANALPPRPVRDALKAAGVGLEFMSTEAAARTYNVLASEGRRMAAALIAV
ncbi:Mth938-like domain-containing protein [Caulobacter sp.]|uniref:Mth938-like domain-containing protein n=1 Tax=Caulobacter sp. TaxID=78 RepID=UPI002B45B4C3|nr:MTH938/NDUFAF3 family protein [Caulobacter sp.]HJV40694.1 MTH938/NDUFAF3 family protein [Caulobacter sp.]